MEALYKKLHDKYTKLKTEKLSEFDQLNKDQEVKFMNYISAAEEVIEHLESEKKELHKLVDDLRNEVASIRVAKDNEVADYQRLAMEESKKNEVLLEEIEKFKKLHQEEISGDLKKNNHNMVDDDHFEAIPNTSSKTKTKKRKRLDASEKIVMSTPCEIGKDSSVLRDSAVQDLCQESANVELDCSRGANDQSGVKPGSNWHIIDMKLSTDYQTGQSSISALHQSSGYSFSLTWLTKAPEEEAELLYHVLSLGLLELVAPEWMREDIKFSTTMYPIFFERIFKVIELCH